MRRFIKLTTCVFIFAVVALLVALRSRAQERATDESSVLVEPPANAAPTDSQTAIDEQSPAATETPALPPPEQPTRQPAAAEPRQRDRARQPFLRPAEPESAATQTAPLREGEPDIVQERLPAPPGPDISIQPTPRIVTHASRSARRMFRSTGEVQLVMAVKNPADGCLYEIPMCVPACCAGEPQMDSWCGLFGRGVVEFCWECGFTAKVKFRHILGDVKVEYDG